MTMTLASLFIRPIRSIRRTDAFIHDVKSSYHPTIASYYSDGDRFHFRRNKHVQYAVKINTEDKRRETYAFVCIPRSLSVSRELTVPCQYIKFQNPSVKVNMEEKHSETCMFTSFFKREPRTNRALAANREIKHRVFFSDKEGHVT